MWRWVTRGLVLTVIALCASAMVAQTFTFHGDVDAPDPERTHSGLVMVRGWALNPVTINSIELYVDDQFQHKAIMFLPRIDIEQAYPDWPCIHNASRLHHGSPREPLPGWTAHGRDPRARRRRPGACPRTAHDHDQQLDQSAAVRLHGHPRPGRRVQRLRRVPGLRLGRGHGRSSRSDRRAASTAPRCNDPRPDVGQTFPDFSGATFSGFVANLDSTRIREASTRCCPRDGQAGRRE
jgi:hypothetical protein